MRRTASPSWRQRWQTFAERRLLRLPASETAPIRLTQRRIYVLPSRNGLALGATLLVMLIASINYNLALGYALTFLIAGAAAASTFHAFRTLLGLEIRPGRSDAVFCGEAARFHLILANPSPLVRQGIVLPDPTPPAALSIAAHGESEVLLTRKTERRGPLSLGRVVLETRYPLGLVRAWSVLFPAQHCLVYPAPENDAPEWPQAAGDQHPRGRHGNAGNDDFAGLRNHRDGDPPRHIAWKAVARGGTLLTKTYEGNAGADVMLDWHSLPDTLHTEKKLARLTAWVLRADQAGQPYTLRLAQTQLGPDLGPVHLQACLAALALFQAPSAAKDH